VGVLVVGTVLHELTLNTHTNFELLDVTVLVVLHTVDVLGAKSLLAVGKMPKRVESLKALKVAVLGEYSGKPRLSKRIR
jgi:hypothetical protein